jgi:hypothetical protein
MLEKFCIVGRGHPSRHISPAAGRSWAVVASDSRAGADLQYEFQRYFVQCSVIPWRSLFSACPPQEESLLLTDPCAK